MGLLGYLETLDISRNSFTGSLPENIGDMVSLGKAHTEHMRLSFTRTRYRPIHVLIHWSSFVLKNLSCIESTCEPG